MPIIPNYPYDYCKVKTGENFLYDYGYQILKNRKKSIGGKYMNNIRKVSEMLGLEWDESKNESEEFEIVDYNNFKYKFKIDGLYFTNGHGNLSISSRIGSLLTGELKIKKLNWKPELHEIYYSYNVSLKHVTKYYWSNDNFDNQMYELGICFKTAIEATNAIEKIRQFCINEFKKG